MTDRFMLLPRIGTKGNGRCSATYPIVVCMKNKETHVCARTQNQLVVFARGRMLKGMLTLNSVNFIYSASMCLFKKSSCLWDALHYPEIPVPRMKRHLLKHIKDVFHLISVFYFFSVSPYGISTVLDLSVGCIRWRLFTAKPDSQFLCCISE